MAVNLKDLKKGTLVRYVPQHYKAEDNWENGVVKTIKPEVKDGVWVVYNCGGEWSRYEEYTAAKTHLEDLELGWRY